MSPSEIMIPDADIALFFPVRKVNDDRKNGREKKKMSSMIKKAIAVILAAAMVISLFGCASGGRQSAVKDSPAPTEASPEETAPAETEPAETEPAEPEKYDFDRNNVDLSGYGLQEYKDEEGVIHMLETAVRVDRLYSSSYPEGSEVWIKQYDHGNSYRIESGAYSFSFESLPEYDEEKEQDYLFNGSTVSFKLFNMPTDGGLELIEGRNVTDEYDHAFVIKTIAQKEYTPYKDDGGQLKTRLVICVKNDSGIVDTFLITGDLYVLHFEGEPDEVILDGSMITDISTEPVPPEWFFDLAAMAVHYMHGERITSKDYFGIFQRYMQGDYDYTIAEAFEHAEIELEYDGRKKQLDDYEEFKAFIMLLNGDILDSFTNKSACFTVNWPVSPEGALKVSVHEKPKDGADEETFSTEFFVLPDGRVMQEKREIGFNTYFGMQTLSILAKARMVFVTEDEYAFDELISFMD